MSQLLPGTRECAAREHASAPISHASRAPLAAASPPGRCSQHLFMILLSGAKWEHEQQAAQARVATRDVCGGHGAGRDAPLCW